MNSLPQDDDDSLLSQYDDFPPPPRDKTAAEAYVQKAIQSYQSRGERDNGLWIDYGNDFCNWTVNSFKLLSHKTIKKLRDFLRKNGVYIPKGRNVSMVNALITCAEELEQPHWPEQELKEELDKGMNSSLDPKDPGAIRRAKAKEIWAKQEIEASDRSGGVVAPNRVSPGT